MRGRQLSIALPVVIAGGTHALPALAGLSGTVARLLGISRRVDAPRGIALTFDDGPHPRGTPRVLDMLDEHGVRATFFLVGEQVAKDRGLAREVRDRGHTIGLHCQRHRNQLRLTPRQLNSDLDAAFAEIAEATGGEPVLYRPPYGVFSAAGVLAARRRNWLPLLWTKAGNDWEARATAASIAARVTSGLNAGDVLLLHDADHYSAPGSWRRTADALPVVIAAIRARGLECAVPETSR